VLTLSLLSERLKAWATLLSLGFFLQLKIFPLETLFPGQSPSEEANALAVLQQDISVPFHVLAY